MVIRPDEIRVLVGTGTKPETEVTEPSFPPTRWGKGNGMDNK